jgi:ABC-type multidrug transport system fused ATPase/permease subunit
LFLIVRTESCEHVAEHGMCTDDSGKSHPSAREFLEDHRERRAIDFIAAVLVRHVQSEETKLLHGLHKSVGVFIAVLEFCGDRYDVPIHKITNHLRDHLLMLGQFNHYLLLCVTLCASRCPPSTGDSRRSRQGVCLCVPRVVREHTLEFSSSMIQSVILVLLIVVIVSAAASWRARGQLLLRIRNEWGQPRKRQRDMEAIADYFCSREQPGDVLDDRTWRDLLLDETFAYLDRTESTVGQQILYKRLRSNAGSLAEFEDMVTRMSADTSRRERAQVALARLRDPAGYSLHRLTFPETLQREQWHIFFPIWTAAVLVTLSLSIFWPKLIFTALLVFVVNFVIRISTARRVSGEITWFRQVGPLLSAARKLSNDSAPLTASLKSDLDALKRLGTIARWVSRDPYTANEIVFAVTEYLNVLLLMDANALYFAARELQLRGTNLRRVIEAVGEIDAAIAVASFRTGMRQWTRPRFLDPASTAMFTNIRHPLLDNAVPNSLTLAPPHGLLVTGSNMSGKSTLLRTLGINVVLAQAVNTCVAESYSAPIYQVRSCIGRSDDLIGGKSYYLVEVESVLSLVRASESSAPHLFIFDELFRGTNAVERIAAAEAVLATLTGGGKPHVTT